MGQQSLVMNAWCQSRLASVTWFQILTSYFVFSRIFTCILSDSGAPLSPEEFAALYGFGGYVSNIFPQGFCVFRIRQCTVEPRFNEVAGDRPNLFVKSRVRYIENLDITNLRGNDQNVRYIEVIVNDWFVTQVTSVTQFNAIFVTQKCRVLRCNSLSMVAFSSNSFHFWADAQLLFTKERHFQSSDLKMLQHGGYTESEEVNRTNKRQRR